VVFRIADLLSPCKPACPGGSRMREEYSSPVGLGSMGGGPGRILVIAEDPWARDTIRVLLSSMGCQCVMAPSVEQARTKLGQENPDAAVVDTHHTTDATSPGISGLDELCRRLRGRIIIVTGEGHDPEVAALIQKYGLPQISRERLLQDLWSTLNSLPQPSSVFRRVISSARLIFDSFLQPAPAGIRISQLAGRRFVYQADSLMVDLSIGPSETNSRHISVVGQLLDSAKPERQLDILSVALQGPKGQIAFASTNEFGEFHFECDLEQNIKVEIETAANRWISLVLPRLEGLRQGVAGAG
jgi:CheY-like chemotaxis protein